MESKCSEVVFEKWIQYCEKREGALKDIKEKICVGLVMHWRFRIPYFKRHLRHG